MTIIRKDSHTELSQQDRNRLKTRERGPAAVTPDKIEVGTGLAADPETVTINKDGIRIRVPAGGQGLETYVGTEEFPRIYLKDHEIRFGSGTATADVAIFRDGEGVGTWETTGRLRFTVAAFTNALEVKQPVDTIPRLIISSEGKLKWGDGTTQDSALERIAANVLDVSGKLTADEGLESALVLTIAGTVPAALATYAADYTGIVPMNMTWRRIKAMVKTAVTSDTTIEVRRSTDGGATFATAFGTVVILNGAKSGVSDPSNLNVNEGDAAGLSITVGGGSGTNLAVSVIGTPR